MALTYPSTSLSNMNPEATLNNAKRKLDDCSPPTPPKRTKTLGPFVMDDDDEEDDADSYLYNEPNPSATSIRSSTANAQLQASHTQTVGPFAMDDDDNAADVNSYLYTDSQSMLAGPGSTNFPPQNSGTRVGITASSTSPSASREMQIGRTSLASSQNVQPTVIKTCSGKTIRVPYRKRSTGQTYEQMIASRSVTAPGRATKSYYGIDIHQMLDAAVMDATAKQNNRPTPGVQQSIEVSTNQVPGEKRMNSMWTEKYRARRFKDLIGDERTHRAVMRWLKGWDPVVFPGLARQKARKKRDEDQEERQHKKIMLLTGPPGLGKTTLAHVCAKQAGYEVLEINASDERSKNVVKGRIRDAVGTENVKGMTVEIGGKKTRKTGKPVCVVVDEVDGVVTGSGGGGGEGGFMKALVDLLVLDQKNSNRRSQSAQTSSRKNKKGDRFRLLRPIILICNDVYHPSLRPLRTSFLAEIIHVRSVPLEQVVQRTKAVFEKEGIRCDGDGVRKLCEASWGMSGNKDRGSFARGVSEGDIRGVMVTAEWIAHQLRSSGSSTRLTRKWVEQHILNESQRDGPSKGLGRGGTKEVVERVFVDGAGFPYKHGSSSFNDPFSRSGTAATAAVGVADLRKRYAIDRLRQMVDAAGEYDRCITDCFLSYPTQSYQDDTILSKPNAAYDWLHFHDSISSRVFSHQDWELNPYLSQSVIAFHHLFASSDRPHARNPMNDEEEEHPFSGSRADFSAYEAEKQNRSIITEFRASLSAPLLRNFRSLDTIAMELVPNLIRMLAPEVKPVVVGGSGGQASTATVRKESERTLVKAAVGVMHGVGITFDKTRVEMENGSHGGFIYRMEPPLDVLSSYSKVKDTPLAMSTSSAPVRYAIRQVLEQEYRKEMLRRQAEFRQKRLDGANGPPSNGLLGPPTGGDEPNGGPVTELARLNGPKRDFFGRIIVDKPTEKNQAGNNEKAGRKRAKDMADEEAKVWVSFHEGFSNAVRKGITMKELLASL